MSFLSVLVLFLAVISLTITNIEGNPKQQIHALPNGLISNQLSTIEPHTSGPYSRRSLLQKLPGPPIVPIPPTPPVTPPETIPLSREPPSIPVPPVAPMLPPPPEQ
ncbi:hypothetical protein P8452_30782 [Trifolium repens]|nr:hypothetical protein P8452_30782 [Trifolium repens]